MFELSDSISTLNVIFCECLTSSTKKLLYSSSMLILPELIFFVFKKLINLLQYAKIRIILDNLECLSNNASIIVFSDVCARKVGFCVIVFTLGFLGQYSGELTRKFGPFH